MDRERDYEAMMKIDEMWKKYCSRLKEKIRLLDSFAQVTAKMKDAIECKDIPGMALHVKERQGIIDRVERIDREVDQLAQGDGFSIEKLSSKAKDLFRSHLDQIKRILESFADVDKECVSLAEADHEALRSDILNARRGLSVAKGYRGSCHQGPRFLDIKR